MRSMIQLRITLEAVKLNHFNKPVNYWQELQKIFFQRGCFFIKLLMNPFITLHGWNFQEKWQNQQLIQTYIDITLKGGVKFYLNNLSNTSSPKRMFCLKHSCDRLKTKLLQGEEVHQIFVKILCLEGMHLWRHLSILIQLNKFRLKANYLKFKRMLYYHQFLI